MEDIGHVDAGRRTARYPEMSHRLWDINTETRLLGTAAKIEACDKSVACCVEKCGTQMNVCMR